MTPSVGRPSTTGWRTAALALMAGAAVAAAWAGPASPAQAAEACDGVWVVVDASEVGGELSVRCAEGDPGSGFAALTAVGHDYSFVPRIPGMICTIDGRPDPCNGAPEDAYWSYWRAEEGGSWSYASRGAGDQDPRPGDVEGWAFGAGDPPGTAPPAPATDSDEEGATDTSDGSRDADTDTSDDGDAVPSGSDGGQAAGSSDGGDGGGSSAPEGDDTEDGTDGDGAAGDDQSDEDDAASSTDRDGDVDRDGPQVPRPSADEGTEDTEGDERGDDPDDEDGTSRADDGSGEVEDADEVAIGGRSGGADWAGVAVGTTLAAALAGGAVLQGRRRRLEP